MDDMTVDETLTWCRFSCGSSVHNKCMKVWAEHKVSSGDRVTCPLCRQEWRPGQVSHSSPFAVLCDLWL